MIPLETNQRALQWIYGFPPEKSPTKWKRIGYFAFALSSNVALFSGFLSSVVFISKFRRVDLEGTIYALFHGAGALNMLYQSIVILFLRRELASIFENLEKIHAECKRNSFFLLLITQHEYIKFEFEFKFR